MTGPTAHRKPGPVTLPAAPEAVVEPVGAGPACNAVGTLARGNRPHHPPPWGAARWNWSPGASAGKADMKHNLTLVVLTREQIAQAREANGRRKGITHALVCGPYGQMFETERQCIKYFTLWDPDHRIEVAPGKFQALFADLFDEAVKTTAFPIGDYRTTPDLAARLMVAAGTAPPAGPSLRRFLGRILARK